MCRHLLISILSALALSAQAQKLETPSTILNDQLPKWVRFSFDHRFRFENYQALRFKQDNDDQWLLNRFRINMTLQPGSWFSFTFQAQDARVFFKQIPAGAATFTNRTDLRMAFIDFGDMAKSRIALRFGRQELAYGEDRLLGAANWGNVARTFDAAKLVLRQGPNQLDLFSASVVRIQPRGLSHHTPGNNLHGAYFFWRNLLPGASFEPYFFWRLSRAANGRTDRRVIGLRWLGPLPARLDYSTEFVQQFGNTGPNDIRAFASHLVLRYSFARAKKWKPHWLAEYNYASGDKNPNDRLSTTFDQIYPTPHNKTGLADQIGWVNIHNVSTTFDFTPWPKFVVRAGLHDWHLVQANDALYLTNGSLVYRDPTGRSGTHIGQEADILGTYTNGPHIVSFGYGKIFPGPFLKNVSPGSQLHYVFLNVGYRF